MKNIFVSIVSEQAMPNILFLKHFTCNSRKDIRYIFISTKTMEERHKSDNIKRALKLDDSQTMVIVVPEDSVKEIKKVLEQEIITEEAVCFTVNMTGGTKLMSLAVYEFFLKKKAWIYYVEIRRQNIIRIQPEDPSFVEHLREELTPYEYIEGAGMTELEHQEKAIYDESTAIMIKDWFLNHDIKKETEVFEVLRGRRNKKLTEINGLISGFLDRTGFSTKSPEWLDKAEVQYLTGGWFEEYIYYILKRQLGLEESAIWLNLKLKKPVKNEIDITFIYKNCLYLIECKTSHMVMDRSIAAEVQYKAAAISRQFGLSVKPYFVTLSSLRDAGGCIRTEIMDRSEAMGVVVRDKKDVLDGNLIREGL